MKLQKLIEELKSKGLYEAWKLNRKHWRERAYEIEDELNKKAESYMMSTEELYDRIVYELQQEIYEWYGRYNDIQWSDVHKNLNSDELKRFRMTLSDYIAVGTLIGMANSWINQLKSYQERKNITRIEELQIKIRNSVEKIASYKSEGVTKTLNDIYDESFYRMIHASQEDFIKIKQDFNLVAKEPWAVDGKNFSERIWGQYRPELVKKLNDKLALNIIQGKKPDDLINEIAHDFKVDRSKAATLVYTEKSYFQSKGQHEAFKQLGVKYYEIVATLDLRTSAICREMDGKVFPLSEYEIGVTANPFHPRCRTVTAPFYEVTERMARDLSTDKSVYVPKMSYKEWYEKNVSENSYKYRVGTNDVDLDYIKSPEFRNKFNKLTSNTKVNDALRNYATAMLEHRNGTDGEDLYIIDDKGNLILRKTSGKNELGVHLNDGDKALISKHRGKMYAIHNHPTNVPPTGSDFATCGYRQYIKSFVVTHSGELHSYSVGNKPFYGREIDAYIDSYLQKGYSVDEALEKTLQDVGEEYQIKWQKNIFGVK